MNNLTIENYLLPAGEFYNATIKKNTIYLHHTASSGNPYSVIEWWKKDRTKDNKQLPVAAAFVIGGRGEYDGKILRAFDEKLWSHHLGTKLVNNVQLNKQSIAIEICNYGPIKLVNGKYINYVGGEVKADTVYTLNKPWRGYTIYEEYTDKQIESLKLLLIYLRDTYGINIKKKWTAANFEIDQNAVLGLPGIFTHSNCRSDKFDLSPSQKMMAMLNTL